MGRLELNHRWHLLSSLPMPYPASSLVTYLHLPGLQLSIYFSEPLVPLSTQLLAQGDVVSESGTLEPDSGIGYRDAQQAACSLAAMGAAVPALRQAMAAAPMALQVLLGRVPCRRCYINHQSQGLCCSIAVG